VKNGRGCYLKTYTCILQGRTSDWNVWYACPCDLRWYCVSCKNKGTTIKQKNKEDQYKLCNSTDCDIKIIRSVTQSEIMQMFGITVITLEILRLVPRTLNSGDYKSFVTVVWYHYDRIFFES
jgi:hypothetical protein